jgi:hypothetical protein
MFRVRQWFGPVVDGLRARFARQHRPGVARRLHPRLEELERREVPTVQASLFLVMAPPPIANLDVEVTNNPEVVTIDHGSDATGPYTSVNGQKWYDANFCQLEIHDQIGGSTFNLRGTPADTWVGLQHANETVNFGGPQGVQNIQGVVHVYNGGHPSLSMAGSPPVISFFHQGGAGGPPPNITLNVSDAGTFLPQLQVALDSPSDGVGLLSGLGPGQITWDASATNSVNVTTGNGVDTVSVLATPTGSPVCLDSAGGTDIVNVGNNHNAQGVKGPLSIRNSPSFTTLTIDDSLDSTFHSVTHDTWTPLQDSPYGVINGLTQGQISYRYADTSSVTVLTGAAGPVVDVEKTGVPLTLVGHSLSTVKVGTTSHTVQNLSGSLTIQNPPNYTALVVDDSGDASARTVTLDTTSGNRNDANSLYGRILGLAPAPITYRYLDTWSVTLDTSAGGGTTAVLATGVALSLTSHGSSAVNVGNASHGVQDIHGGLSLHGNLLTTDLTINNAADTGNRQLYYGVINGQDVLDGLSTSARIAFDPTILHSLVIQIGSGQTVFHQYAGASFPFFTVWKDANGNNISV